MSANLILRSTIGGNSNTTKNAPLTNAEMDQNFINLDLEIDNAVTTLTGAINARAPLASPALTGTPTAPTASAGTNTTQVATTAFVNTAIVANDPIPMAIALG